MLLKDESTRCLHCLEAPCTQSCPKGKDPARGIMAIRMHNRDLAGMFFSQAECADCDAPCQKACLHPDRPIDIRRIAMEISPVANKACPDFSNLEITFLGVQCENPFFLASSVIASNYDMISRAFDMGWAGAAYKTISKERICEVSPRYDQIGKGSTSFVGFRNMEQLSENSPETDFEIIRKLKKNYPRKVIIASIMGNSPEQWQELAIEAEQAGADIIECNFSCPHMEAHGMGSDIGQRPDLVALYTKAVKDVVKIPVMTKMTPNITHIEEPALASFRSGADAIAAINTIKSITMHEEAEVSNQGTISGYSGRAVKPIAQRMILDMKQQKELREVPMSGMGGIESWHDAYEFLSIGCSTVQVCTSVMQYGYRIIDDLRLGLSNYLASRGVGVKDIIGENIDKFVHPDSLDRKTYVLPKFDHQKCIGCGRCFLSCQDAGHQAIIFDSVSRQPRLDVRKCVGCLLCRLICPNEAIGISPRMKKKEQN